MTNLKQIDQKANVYLTVSAMGRNARGEFRRRKENFVGGLLLMIDDLGTKFPLSTINPLPPTCLTETSPGNFQAIYMFDSLVTDMELCERLIRGFIAKQFLGQDTGMAGINRVFRPPIGVNGKAKYNGWHVRCAQLNAERRYSVKQIAAAFGIDVAPPGKRKPFGATADKAASIRHFVEVRSALRSAGMLKRENADMAGWQDITCPWTDGHTGAVDNGAAICEPNEENGFTGGFKCHHGSCEDRGWRELTDWISENQEEILKQINNRHFDFGAWKNDRSTTDGDGARKRKRIQKEDAHN